MSTFGYDFSEAEEMGDFVTLTPGRYIFALQSVEKGESASGNPKAILRFRVVAGNDAYVGGVISAHWPVTGKGAFRFRAMLKAFGVNFKDKGKINLGKYIGEEFGARVTLTEGNEKNEAGETVWFHELNAILPVEQYADLLDEDYEEDDEEEDDFEDEEDFEEEDDDEEIEEDEEFEEGEEITVEDLEDMDLDEPKELAEEWDVSTKPAKGKKKLTQAQMRKRLTEVIEEMADEEDDEPEDEEEEDDDVLTEEDIEEMDLSDLKELAEEYEITLPKVPKGKRLTASKVRKVLLAELFPDEEEDEEDEDEEPF